MTHGKNNSALSFKGINIIIKMIQWKVYYVFIFIASLNLRTIGTKYVKSEVTTS